MDSQVNEKDFALLARDPYTFFVLDRILRENCALVRTDHETLIFCQSEPRYPIWIWTPDGCPEEVKERAWALAETRRPLGDGYRYNMKYDLAGYFMEKGRKSGQSIGYFMQLYAYDCPAPLEPEKAVEGKIHCCAPGDIEEIAGLMARFQEDIGEEPQPLERRLEKARFHADTHSFFFWKDGAGKTVACCSYRVNQGRASLGCVYTKPEERRKHYAQRLVYEVTKRVKDMGFTPMLYTDANYIASNACYESIGYTLKGKLCTVAAL